MDEKIFKLSVPRCSATYWQYQDVGDQSPQLYASPRVLGQLAPCRGTATGTPHTDLAQPQMYSSDINAHNTYRVAQCKVHTRFKEMV